MEVPKRRRGRPRLSEEDRKNSRERAKARARFRGRADVDIDKRRLRLHLETFQQWKLLKEKVNINSDDGFARLLLKCFSEHIDQYREECRHEAYQTSLPYGIPIRNEQPLYIVQSQARPNVDIKMEKPKRKRGRPPGRRNGSIKQILAAAPTPQYTYVVKKAIVQAPVPRASLVTPPDRLLTAAEDTSNLSPSVRSARLAFSKALAQSLASPSRTESVRRSLILSNTGEILDTEGIPIDAHLNQHHDSSNGAPPNFGQATVMGIHPMDDGQPLNDGTLEPSHRLIPVMHEGDFQPGVLDEGDFQPGMHVVREGDCESGLLPDSAEEGYFSHPSAQYSEVLYGDENLLSAQCQPEQQISSNEEDFAHAEINGSSNVMSDPDPSPAIPPGPEPKEDPDPITSIEKYDSKVPDQSRRSRINQITGGLLNRLKMRAVTAEHKQD